MLVKAVPLLEMADNWEDVLVAGADYKGFQEIHRHECTGRPLDCVFLVGKIEAALGRCLHRRKPGPKSKNKEN